MSEPSSLSGGVPVEIKPMEASASQTNKAEAMPGSALPLQQQPVSAQQPHQAAPVQEQHITSQPEKPTLIHQPIHSQQQSVMVQQQQQPVSIQQQKQSVMVQQQQQPASTQQRQQPVMDQLQQQHASTQQQPVMDQLQQQRASHQPQPVIDQQQQPAPVQTQPVMGQQQRASTQQQPVMGQQQRASTQQQPVMGQQQRASTQQQPVMGQQQQPVPVQTQPVMGQQQRASTQQQPVMGQQQRASTQQQPVMGQQQRASTQQQPVPVQTQPVMGQQQRASIQQQPVMGQQQRASTQQQPVMGQQQQPVPVQTQPVMGQQQQPVMGPQQPASTKQQHVMGQQHVSTQQQQQHSSTQQQHVSTQQQPVSTGQRVYPQQQQGSVQQQHLYDQQQQQSQATASVRQQQQQPRQQQQQGVEQVKHEQSNGTAATSTQTPETIVRVQTANLVAAIPSMSEEQVLTALKRFVFPSLAPEQLRVMTEQQHAQWKLQQQQKMVQVNRLPLNEKKKLLEKQLERRLERQLAQIQQKKKNGPAADPRAPTSQQHQGQLKQMLMELNQQFPPGTEWIEAKDPHNQSYWYSRKFQRTYWYNPEVVKRGLTLLIQAPEKVKEIPPQIMAQLKLYKQEREQLKLAERQRLATAQKSEQMALQQAEFEKKRREALEAQRIHQEKQMELLRKRQEYEREQQRLRMIEMEKKRVEDERLEAIRYQKAQVETVPRARALLRKCLDSIGYDSTWVSDAMVNDALSSVKPPDIEDEAQFNQSGDAAIAFYKQQKKEKELKQEAEERNLMQKEDFDTDKQVIEEARKKSEEEKERMELEKEFDNFFKFRSFKAMQRHDWNPKLQEEMDLAQKANQAAKKRKRDEERAILAAATMAGSRPKRQVKSRLVSVEGHMVLKLNNYSMEEGGLKSKLADALPTDLRRRVRSARSAFNFFSSDTSQAVKAQFPHYDFRDVQRAVSKRWRELDPVIRAEYEKRAADDKIRHNTELQAAYEQEQKNIQINEERLRKLQEEENLIQKAKEESKALEHQIRTKHDKSNSGRVAPKTSYDDIVLLAFIGQGARASLSLEDIQNWVKGTQLGRFLIGRLKSDFDSLFVQKAIRKGINKRRYVNIRARGRTRDLVQMKVEFHMLQEVVNSYSYAKMKELEKSKKGNSRSFTAEKLRKSAMLEEARVKHRDDMLKQIFEANQRQWGYMYRHKDMLEPFITDQVKKRLEKAAELLRKTGKGDLLVHDPSGYDQEDKALEEIQTPPQTPSSTKLFASEEEEITDERDVDAEGENTTATVATKPTATEDSTVTVATKPAATEDSTSTATAPKLGGTSNEARETSLPSSVTLPDPIQVQVKGSTGEEEDAPKVDLSKRRRRPALPQPKNIVWGKMRPYQKEGLRWLVSTYENGINAILADEMGLGKTLQTISFLTHLKFEMNVSGPFLVIVPLSVLTAWANEFQRWSPDMKVVKLHSSSKEERDRIKKHILNDMSKFDVVITTFEMVISSNMKYIFSSKMWWRYVVIDEGHKIKNDETDLSVAVRSINCMGRLLLTGTPLQNNLHELWSLLNYLYPAVFTESETFDGCFDLAKQIVETDMLEKAHYLIRPFVLRRTKSEVEQKMPPKEEIEVKVPLSDMQRHYYRQLLLRDAKLLERVEQTVDDTAAASTTTATTAASSSSSGSTVSDWKKLQSLMMQLRKCCNHPFLFPGAGDGSRGEALIEASGKLTMLDRILKKLQARGHRVVIFSQFTATIDLISEFMTYRRYKFSRLDGSTNRVQRAIDIMQFNKPNSDYFAYLMSTRAGGLGINLATADTVVLYDSDWNPQVDLQAQDRVHRIGQTKPVHIYRLVAAGTVEERIVQRAKKKLYLDKMVNRGSTSQAEALESLSKAEMLKMLKFGASAVFGADSTSGVISDASLDKMMDRNHLDGKEDTDLESKTLEADRGGAALNALEFDGTEDLLDIRQLGGVDLAEVETQKREEEATKRSRPATPVTSTGMSLKDIAKQWESMERKPKRSRTSRFVEIDGHTILKANNYTLEEGEKSVYMSEIRDSESSNDPAVEAARRRAMQQNPTGRQVAGRDYDNEGHCLVCWDGGDLLLCDQCCASYHHGCLQPYQLPVRRKNGQIGGSVSWGCPHHSCKVCARKAAASGGMLFRCTECPNAFCEDHLPVDDVHLNSNGRCPRFEELGQRKPAQAYFIQCSKKCQKFAKVREKDGVLAAIQYAIDENGNSNAGTI